MTERQFDNELLEFVFSYCENVGCKECPVIKYDCDKRQKGSHDPCVLELYDWLINKLKSLELPT